MDLSKVNKTPHSQLPQGSIFLLVLMPIYGIFLQVYFSELFSHYSISGNAELFTNIYEHKGWFPFYGILALTLCLIDKYNLKKLDIEIHHGLLFALIFMPIYLYFRGVAINKNYNLGWFQSQYALLFWLVMSIMGMFLETWVFENYYPDIYSG